jgi:hypothetical protein
MMSTPVLRGVAASAAERLCVVSDVMPRTTLEASVLALREGLVSGAVTPTGPEVDGLVNSLDLLVKAPGPQDPEHFAILHFTDGFLKELGAARLRSEHTRGLLHALGKSHSTTPALSVMSAKERELARATEEVKLSQRPVPSPPAKTGPPAAAPGARTHSRTSRADDVAWRFAFPAFVLASVLLAALVGGAVPGALAALVGVLGIGFRQARPQPSPDAADLVPGAPGPSDRDLALAAVSCLEADLARGGVPEELAPEAAALLELLLRTISHRGYAGAGAGFHHDLGALVTDELSGVLANYAAEAGATDGALEAAKESLGSLELGAKGLLNALERSTPSHLKEGASVLAAKYGRPSALDLP